MSYEPFSRPLMVGLLNYIRPLVLVVNWCFFVTAIQMFCNCTFRRTRNVSQTYKVFQATICGKFMVLYHYTLSNPILLMFILLNKFYSSILKEKSLDALLAFKECNVFSRRNWFTATHQPHEI